MTNDPPLTLIIFGGTGDLTARKLVPSLYRVDRKKRLPDELRVVGVARSPLGNDAYRQKLRDGLREFLPREYDAAAWDAFARRVFYVAGDATTPGGLDHLAGWFKENEGSAGGRRLYYLAVSPDLYPKIVAGLGEAGMN